MNTLINTMNTAYKNTSILFIAFLILYLTHSPLNAATMVFDNSFESGGISGLSCSGNCPKAVTSPVASGKYSGNFDLTRDMSVPYRTEAVFTNYNNLYFGQEYWFGFNYRYADWAYDSSGEMAPFQVHERTQDWDASCGYGSAYSSAPFYMFSASDRVSLNRFGGKAMWSMTIPKNQWINITLHFKLSGGSDGYIELWKDGVKVATYNGPNTHTLDKCGRPMKPAYLKMGTYKWDWKAGRPATKSTRRQFFLDNIKLATGSDGYSLVSSKSTTTTTTTTTQDTTPPAISNVQAAVTDTTATITWNTNEASNSAVNYGLTTSYGSNAGNSLAVTSHSVTLQNLTSNSLYHYRVSSKDSSGNTGNGTDLTFTTTRASGEDVVAYWPMDPGTGTTLPDLSGNGHTGKLINGALLTTSGGVKFDGVNDYANVGKFDIAGKAMSISAWVWADDLKTCPYWDCRIISKATGLDEQAHYFMVSPVQVGSVTRLRFRLKTGGVTSTLVAASGNLANKTWFHVAAVYDGQTMRLYKDGVEVGSMAKSGSITTNSNASVWIGGNPANTTARPWKGQIDDVSLYSYALTKEEVAELAQ